MSIRQTAAVTGLVAFAALIPTLAPISSVGAADRVTLFLWGLLPAVGVTLAGVARGAPWARWLALGSAVAVFPWALALTIAPLGLPVGRQVIALAASLAVLGGLAHPPGVSSGPGEARGRASGLRELVGWTIAANIASVLALALFAVAFDYRTGWHMAVVWAFLVVLSLGVAALGRGKTAGALGIALAGLGLLATGGAFLAHEAHHIGEILLLGSVFLPGIVMGAALACALARPVGRVLRCG